MTNAGNIGTQGPKTSGSGSDTVRLGNVFRELWSGLPTIVLAAVIGGMIALLGTIFLITPTYKSTTSLYVMSNEEKSTSVNNTDLQAGTLLTKDYEEIIKSREVIEEALTSLDIDADYGTILKDLSVNTPDDTRVIYITVTYTDPYTAADIANAVRRAAIQRIQSIIDVKTVKVVSDANVPVRKESPSYSKAALVGAFAGALLAVIILVIMALANDTIRTGDDIEKYLHISLLGTIPIAEGEKRSKKVYHRKRGGGRA
ncbi:MAG: Wzz/FepE/Etk N-terminal domain-containing protein [Eubacteriales bacterium]|jgi:capsular polysaccharide biosynthesis protein|nr:Wzz/FepE/Etk N-terminal domain-containing protein [Eubacteriales bacterium]